MKLNARYLTVLARLAVMGLAAVAAAGCASDRTANVEPAMTDVQPAGKHYQAARDAFRAGNPEQASTEVRLALGDTDEKEPLPPIAIPAQ
jgi:hypothetical protein